MLPTVTRRGSASQPAGTPEVARTSSATVATTIATKPKDAIRRTSWRAVNFADRALAPSSARAFTPNIAPYWPALSPIIDW